jgi:hypothetical protein
MTDWPGAVVSVDDTHFHVDYDAYDSDGQPEPTQPHLLTDRPMHTKIIGSDADDDDDSVGTHDDNEILGVVNTTRANWVSHSSVPAYIGDNEQILPQVLTGEIELPPQPPLPPYTREQHPPLPPSIRHALAGADALFWLHATVKEFATLHRTSFT